MQSSPYFASGVRPSRVSRLASRAARASRGWPSSRCGIGRTGSRLTATEKVKECPRTIQALIDVLLIRVAHVLRVDLEFVPRLDQLIPIGVIGFPPRVPIALVGECSIPVV